MVALKRVVEAALLVVLFSSPTLAGDAPLGPAEWPTTVAGAVGEILSGMSEKDKELVKSTRKEDLIRFHHGWGTGIRNHYGLWRGNEDLIRSACGKPCHPDDASMIIVEAVWAELQTK